MAHREAEYDAAGHEVTILQVNEGGDIHGWIDGWAAYFDDAVEHLSEVPDDITEKVNESDKWSAMETLFAWMVENDKYFCKNCKSFYNSDDVSSTGFAGHQCMSCNLEEQICPDSPTGDHDDECLNPGQKRNARVPTKYRCVHCGRKRQTTPTG